MNLTSKSIQWKTDYQVDERQGRLNKTFGNWKYKNNLKTDQNK